MFRLSNIVFFSAPLFASLLTLMFFFFMPLDQASFIPILALFIGSWFLIYSAMRITKHILLKRLHLAFPSIAMEARSFDDCLHLLSQHMRTLSARQDKEIDLLTEREVYRRDFLGNVSHELKTPLFSIQGFLLTLIEGGVDDENIRDRYLIRINKSVERLIYIVKDLDMINEIESETLKISPKPFDIVALTHEVFDLLEIKANKYNVSLQANSYPRHLYVVGDLERIEQVMTNLISNAIHHAQKKEATIIVHFKEEAKRVKISITDNGKGISPEHILRIFERFYRIEKSRSRKDGGSGLGLAIVKHILNAHHEKIYVESTPNVHTSFYFYLNKA